jgi:DNA-directed RNA polymerase subunit RPC12/RpoP
LCGREDDRLYPLVMEVCIACANRFIQRATGLKVLKRTPQEYYCDHCRARTFMTFKVNPSICIYCSKNLGKTHRIYKEDVIQDKAQMDELKKKRGIKI